MSVLRQPVDDYEEESDPNYFIERAEHLCDFSGYPYATLEGFREDVHNSLFPEGSNTGAITLGDDNALMTIIRIFRFLNILVIRGELAPLVEITFRYPDPKVTNDYSSYLTSPAWRDRAEQAKERAGQKCQVCNKPRDHTTLDTHHRTYERLGRELPEDLIVLCRSCHTLFHENGRLAR